MDSGSSAPKILVADDDEDFGPVLQSLLRRRGYTCVWVRDADEAIVELGQASFDLLLSDIDMPGNGRLALVRHVEAHAEAMPVILLTGKPSFESAVDAVGSPVVAYLVKPPSAESLFQRIEQALREGSLRRTRLEQQRRVQAGLAALTELERRLEAGEATGEVRLELARVLRGLLAGPHPADPGKAAGEAERLRRLEEAVRDAVGVLEDTRKAFKSKQLGDLRKRLEQLTGLGR